MKFYIWKAKVGGLDVSNAKKLHAREGENATLTKLLAAQMLERAFCAIGSSTMASAMLKDVASGMW